MQTYSVYALAAHTSGEDIPESSVGKDYACGTCVIHSIVLESISLKEELTKAGTLHKGPCGLLYRLAVPFV